MTMPVIWPAALRMGAPLSLTESSEPSLRSRVVWLPMVTMRRRR